MISRLNLIAFLIQGRKKIIFLSILLSTIFFSLAYSIFTINPLSSKALEEFIINLGQDEIDIPLGADTNIDSSIKDVGNIFAYFQENLPIEIKERQVKNTSIYTNFFLDSNYNASVAINDTIPSKRFDNILITFPDRIKKFLEYVNDMISSLHLNISQSEVNQIDGILFDDRNTNTSYAELSQIIVIIPRENDNTTFITYDFLILNSEFWRNRSVLTEISSSHPHFIFSYDNFQKIGELVGIQNTQITLKFDKETFAEVVLVASIRKSYINFLTEFNSHLKIYQWETIDNFHLDNNVISLYNLTIFFLRIMTILLILTLLPSFLAVFYLISFTETIRIQNFHFNYLRKLFFRGYSKKFISLYYFLETIIVLFFSFFLGLSIASFIESIIIWQIYGYLKFEILNKIIMVLIQPLSNYIPILIILLLLTFLNKQMLFGFSAKLASENVNISIERINNYKLDKLEIRSFLLTIVTFSLLIVSKVLIDKLLPVLFGLIALIVIWSIRVWITYGLCYLGKLFGSFSEKKEKMIVMNIFHKYSFSQTRLTTSLFWILLLSLMIPAAIATVTYNYHRDSYYHTGGDIRLSTGFNTSTQDIEKKLENISDIESYTILYQTTTTFGSEYTPFPNKYELIGVDPNSFFRGKWFNKNFLDSLSVESVITELSSNKAILIPINDYKRLDIKNGDQLKISGYLNYSANVVQEYHMRIADKITYFPSKTKDQIDDLNIQIFASHTLFFSLIENMNPTLDLIILIELKQDSVSEDLYKNLQSIAGDIVVNSILKVEGRSSEYVYTNLQNQLFDIYSRITTNITLLVIVPVSFIFLYYLFYRTKSTIGILESLGIKRKNINQSMILYFISLIFIILIGIGLLCVLIAPFIISIRTNSGLPISIKIRFDTILLVICIESFILALNGVICRFLLDKMPADLIIQRD
ncbi:MAG: hypothetical protein ACFE9L_16925 [Candidatus Hodarchaeota archaeon]